jgi:hypothetical protein
LKVQSTTKDARLYLWGGTALYLLARGCTTATRLDHIIIFKITLEVFLGNSTLCVECLSFVEARTEVGEFVEYNLDNED